MRAGVPGIPPVHISYEGRELACFAGDSVSAALIDAGEYVCREAADGTLRGVFCGMGVCGECLVTIDGRPGERACMTPVRDGMTVGVQPARPSLRDVAGRAAPVREELACDVLVIGAGAAGLTAAAAASEAGLDVVLVDERPKLGGQFYKQPARADRGRARRAVPGGPRPDRRGSSARAVASSRRRRCGRSSARTRSPRSGRTRAGCCGRGGWCSRPARTSAACRCRAGRCPG